MSLDYSDGERQGFSVASLLYLPCSRFHVGAGLDRVDLWLLGNGPTDGCPMVWGCCQPGHPILRLCYDKSSRGEKEGSSFSQSQDNLEFSGRKEVTFGGDSPGPKRYHAHPMSERGDLFKATYR